MKSIIKFVNVSMILILVFNSKLFSQISLLTEPNIKPSLFGEIFYPGNKNIYPAIIILHGSNGLSDNYHKHQEYTLQFVKNGYAVLLIDLFAETGAVEAGSEKRFQLWETWQNTLINGINFLKELPNINKNQIGIIGFSRGAWIALTTIPNIPDVKVIINYYGVGRQSLDDISNIPPILMLYGDRDNYADSSFVLLTYKMLKHKNKNVELIRYQNAGHGFNFYRTRNENELASGDAYKKTLLFLEKYLNTENLHIK